MPVIKTAKKEPTGHEHLDGDFGLDGLAELRAHFKGTGHLKAPFPADSWKVLTRKHMKAHGLTPVDGAPASAEALNAQLGGIQEPSWPGPGFAQSGEWEFVLSQDGGPGHWAHSQLAPSGQVIYHHYHKPEGWPHPQPPEPEPEWDTTVWVSHGDIPSLEQEALATVAAATKKSAHLKVIQGYHVTVLPAPGTMAAQNAAEQVQAAVARGHTIAAHISVGWFPPAPGPEKTGGSLPDGTHPGCAFADHKEYKVVRAELLSAAKILGIMHAATFSLAKLAAAVAVQVKAMDSQLDEVLAQLGIKPPDGTLAVSGGGVNSGKLVPSSLAPQPPQDGTATGSMSWSAAHALLKFAGGLTHDEATHALGHAALNKSGWHAKGIHVVSPDPNSYTAWFDFGPEPAAPEVPGQPKINFDELLGTLAPEPSAQAIGWDSQLNRNQAMFVLQHDSKGQFSHEEAKELLDAAKAKGSGHPVVTARVQVMWCSSGNHYHVGWPEPDAPVEKASTKDTITGKTLHGANTHGYGEALVKLKDLFGMSDAGASELLKNAQDEPGKLLTWKGPKGTAKVKWHLAGGHFHVWAGSW